MIKRSDDALQGMEEIRSYANRSESTIIDWILKRGFPASKIGGGIWESSRTAIDKWKLAQVENDDPENPPIPGKKKN